jgi:peptide methionine sulfoxide reductase msrA/msrB
VKKQIIGILSTLIILINGACSPEPGVTQQETTQPAEPMEAASSDVTQTVLDETYIKQDGIDVIYLAGGCFWGLEKLMESIPGVVNATSGYANGQADVIPTYESVSTGDTGYREIVRVEYDPGKISLDAILFAYFHVIDPTIENVQGNDYGTQYQTGVYYADEEARSAVERIADIERSRHERFVVEIEPLERFLDAEDYHQDYLTKNPAGYCHISRDEFERFSQVIVDPGKYPRPADEVIKTILTEAQYKVTQEAGTERPFANEFWDNHERGIYVDIVTGEPLFSSSDKFDSGTGWPSFSEGIDRNALIDIVDNSHGMVRTEVRSRAGNSHLGHVFYGEPSSPSGTRNCINSAALRFVPYEQMGNEGYSYLVEYVD